MSSIVPSYEKMPDEAQRWGLDEGGRRALARVPWAVTEKIHGANLCFAVEARGLRVACRSRWLTDDEDFFGHRALVPGLEGRLAALRASLALDEATTLLVYGEIFGGAYPHPDVPAVAGVEPVQTGIWYAPGVHWRAFDLATEGPAGRRYVSYERACELWDHREIPYVRPLLIGREAEAMAHPVEFATTIPAELGLPPIAKNLAEGVVVRPWGEVRVHDGAGREVRPRLKRKLPAFAEDARFHEASAWAEASAGQRSALTQHASWLVTEPRLWAVRSKLGAVERQGEAGRRQLVAALAEDALASLEEAWGEAVTGLPAGERGRLERFVQGEAAALVELLLG